MSFEDIKAELALLMIEMENQPEDMHKLYEKVHEKLAELKAFGMPVPDDLVELEKKLNLYFDEQNKHKTF